jgi:hypothetical protein
MLSHLRVAIATAVLATAALSVATPVAAVDAADYVLWRVWQPGHKALIVLESRPGGGARIVGAVKGLENGATYDIIGTNENGSCGSAVTAGNRTFILSVLGNTQANGTWFIGSANGGVWKTTNFIRIREHGGDVWSCARAKPVVVDPNNPNVVYARFASGGELQGMVLVEQLANDRARVFVAMGDVNGDGVDDLSVRGSPNACGSPQGTAAFALKLENVLISSFKSTTVELTPSQLGGLASVRVKKLTGDSGLDWFPACRESILTALLVP